MAAIVRHVHLEPRRVAEVEWRLARNPWRALWSAAWPPESGGAGVRAALAPLFGRAPDWDWWEPRHDQPWRRQTARDRGEAE